MHIILTRKYNNIYFIVDACDTTKETWIAIERLKQGENINRQDVEMKLFWEFGKFTSHEGETLESYYTRFMTIVNQEHDLKEVSYHTLFDILKQHQNEVNELRAKRLAMITNLLALVVTTHGKSQAAIRNKGKSIVRLAMITNLLALVATTHGKSSHNSHAQSTYHQQAPLPSPQPRKTTSSRSQAAIRNKGKVIVRAPSPISESKPKHEYETTKTLIRNDRRTRNNHQKGQNENQRAVVVARNREIIGHQVVQQTGIKCFNCNRFGHMAKECKAPKRQHDYEYHKEKMMLCKKEVAGHQLSAEEYDWLINSEEELEDQDLEAHYIFVAKIQAVEPDVAQDSGPIYNTEPLEKVHTNDEYNVFAIVQ
ncbi:retrovirus-related pol polyprotein from transposon TNT 1-94 [Tanacetum coccineum]|uniref:Retrovirus-related pol polyprotein from transposon TNT 1-94 n=1 Tax=Tanacetum coccineum TaxID=301880 RepID=A0ABQ5HZC5_9ASTR